MNKRDDAAFQPDDEDYLVEDFDGFDDAYTSEEYGSDDSHAADADDEISLSDVENEFDLYQEDLDSPPSGQASDTSLPTEERRKSFFGIFMVLLGLVGLGGAGMYFSGILGGGDQSKISRPYQAPGLHEEAQSGTLPEEVTQDPALQASVESLMPQDQMPAVLDSDQSPAQSPETDIFSLDEVSGYPQESVGVNAAIDNIDEPNALAQQFAKAEPPLSPVTSSSAPAEDPASLSPQIEVVLSRLEDLEGRITSSRNEMTSKLSQIESAQKGKTDLSALEGNLGRLDKKIADLAKRLDSLEKKMSETNSAVKTLSTAQKPKKEATPPPANDASAAVAVAPKTEPAIAVPKPTMGKVSASSWEIRAIQVGSAVIAQKGKDETLSISVGDDVPGLGAVKDINYKDGGWVIEGSSGSIKY
ncbi:MAG: hypothetical protein H6855_02970 [Rhodospirillales bacterium]|nr:hypothetical protein [Rhodospirillales bacterium]MCB9965028.1 hypothetical protein [Rhodospirillales bacterium]MCB9980356.1 hypothetical protein [Rhodospirillales bacterium]